MAPTPHSTGGATGPGTSQGATARPVVPGASLSNAPQLHRTGRRAGNARLLARGGYHTSSVKPPGAGRLRQERARLALAHSRCGPRLMAARRLVELLRRRRELRSLLVRDALLHERTDTRWGWNLRQVRGREATQEAP